jgi:hypothetical protein
MKIKYDVTSLRQVERILGEFEFRKLNGDKLAQYELFLKRYSCSAKVLVEFFSFPIRTVYNHMKRIKEGKPLSSVGRPGILSPEQEQRLVSSIGASSDGRKSMSPSEIRDKVCMALPGVGTLFI